MESVMISLGISATVLHKPSFLSLRSHSHSHSLSFKPSSLYHLFQNNLQYNNYYINTNTNISIHTQSLHHPRLTLIKSAPLSPDYTNNNSQNDNKLALVAKRLEKTSRYFKKLGGFGFWSQLISTVVAAVILSFSVVVTGKITSPVTFYATAGSIVAAFISVFFSFGYIRLSERLRKTANDPSKAPPRADVVKSLKNSIMVNLLGMGAAIFGMQATVGLLVAKALTTSTNPYYQGTAPGSSPVLALDVFLVQASANIILSHFLGLSSSLELLRSVTLPASDPVPRVA